MPPLKDSSDERTSRRDFLAWTAAATALLTSGCFRQPTQFMVPYARDPEGLTPGRPQFYASAFPLDGFGSGILVENHMGRPTKIEGNPLHPTSLGATDAFTQASIMELYDPDRAKSVLREGLIASWDTFIEALSRMLEDSPDGRGVRLLTGPVTSPALGEQIRRFLAARPRATWHRHQPISQDQALRGTQMAFGETLQTRYDFSQADIVVSFDADFLTRGPAHLRNARDFSHRRRTPDEDGPDGLNRLYVLETTPSLTGAVADHRRAVGPATLARLLVALARELGVAVPAPHSLSVEDTRWIGALAADLKAHRGRSLVLAGESMPPVAHALQHRMNEILGNFGATCFFTEPVEVDPVDQEASMHSLVAEMERGEVAALVIIGVNPVYTASADLSFANALTKVPFRAHMSLYHDETSRLCHWHIPEAHFLESWGDVRCDDGTVSIIQPMIEPLFDGRSPSQLVAALLGDWTATSHDVVRNYWQTRSDRIDFEMHWRKWLHDGVVPNSALPVRSPRLAADAVFAEAVKTQPFPVESPFYVTFRPDPSTWDGRFANNAWLQELPKPLINLTWGNAALVHPQTAATLGVSTGDEIVITRGGRELAAPVWLDSLQTEGALGLTLGYGRTQAGRVGDGHGYDAYALRTSDAFWNGPVDGIRRSGRHVALATASGQSAKTTPEFARVASLISYRAEPHIFSSKEHTGPSLISETPPVVPPQPEAAEQWGMAIDLNTCIGCNACIVACQAENNIPVVGKDQVTQGRVMHWLRVDHDVRGQANEQTAVFQPVPCMHCESAPCELVCPVAATAHSHDGLNQMIYNRCVGTRYCSNNCPYKVRRFNFYDYTDPRPIIKLLRNPDVTVRTRGVMEKCTYCIQRIQEARIAAETERRPIEDLEIQTACQQVCPTRSITFGNIKDPDAAVAKLKAAPRNYPILAELNTRPRTTYLARISNPNPLLEGDST